MWIGFVVVATPFTKTKNLPYVYRSCLKQKHNLTTACRECLVVGLGNPGNNLKDTRHNLGFQVVDYYAKRYSLVWDKDKYLVAEYACRVSLNTKVHLLKPLTFMNNSGQSIAAMMRRITFSLENIVVIVDDMNLPFGQTRWRWKGSHGKWEQYWKSHLMRLVLLGGHNGLKSVEKALHSNQYARLRVGIDAPPKGMPSQVYVLNSFSPVEKKQLGHVLEKCAAILDLWVEQPHSQQQLLALANTPSSPT